MTISSPLRRRALLGMAAVAALGAAAAPGAVADAAPAGGDHVLSGEAVSETALARAIGPSPAQTPEAPASGWPVALALGALGIGALLRRRGAGAAV